MSIFSKFRKIKEDLPEAPDKPLPETAISEPSALYSSTDFVKYNPDDLLGIKGYDIYKKMSRDEQIKAGLKFKKDAITSRGFYFDSSEYKDKLGEDESVRRVKIFEKIVEGVEGSFTDCLLKILSAVRDGFSICEKVEKVIEYDGKGYIGLRDIKKRPAKSFRFKVDEYGNVAHLEQVNIAFPLKLDLSNFVHYVVNPEEDPHYGESELRACHRAWWSKDNIIKFRNIFLEKHAGGFTVISPPKGKNLVAGSAEYVNLNKVFNNVNTMTSILMPNSEYKIERHYPSGQGSKAFDEAIDQCDKMMTKALLIPAMMGISPQGNTGGYSQAETQLKGFFWTLKNDSDRLAECLNEQVFKPLSLVNFGDELFPKFTWSSMSTEKAVEVIRLFMELVNSKVLSASPEDEEFIRKSLELPEVVEMVQEPGEAAKDETEGKEKEEDSEEQEASRKSKHEEEEDLLVGETILGQDSIKVLNAAFKKATARVSFALIGKESENVVEDEVENVANVTDTMLRALINKMEKGGSLEESLKDNFKNLKIDRELKTALNTKLNKVLKKGVAIGLTQAKNEIDKAKGSEFSKIDIKRLDFIANDYYKLNAFKITGDLSDALQKIVENEILNGARYGKSLPEVEQAIYLSAAQKGLVSELTASQMLDENTLGSLVASSRLRTTIRTGTFDAINTARDAYFSDPALGDFVRAYEYSAILDSRTTEICRHLDEDNAGDHSKEWYSENAGFKPPNHFNCRSLLVPVTANDLSEFKEGPSPSIEPQEGFK